MLSITDFFQISSIDKIGIWFDAYASGPASWIYSFVSSFTENIVDANDDSLLLILWMLEVGEFFSFLGTVLAMFRT